jgi:hypothetical protein
MARGNSRAQSELPSGAEANIRDYAQQGFRTKYGNNWDKMAAVGPRERASLDAQKPLVGNGQVGNGSMKNGQLHFNDEDVKALVLSMVGPDDEIRDVIELKSGNTSLPFPLIDGEPFIESQAFDYEGGDAERNEDGFYFANGEVTVNAGLLQVDYRKAYGVELDDDSANRLAKSLQKSLNEVVEGMAERKTNSDDWQNRQERQAYQEYADDRRRAERERYD